MARATRGPPWMPWGTSRGQKTSSPALIGPSSCPTVTFPSPSRPRKTTSEGAVWGETPCPGPRQKRARRRGGESWTSFVTRREGSNSFSSSILARFIFGHRFVQGFQQGLHSHPVPGGSPLYALPAPTAGVHPETVENGYGPRVATDDLVDDHLPRNPHLRSFLRPLYARDPGNKRLLSLTACLPSYKL